MYPAILALDEMQMFTQSPSEDEIKIIAFMLQEARTLYEKLDTHERHVYNFLRRANICQFLDDFQDIKEIWQVNENEIAQIQDESLFNLHDLILSFPENKVIKNLLLTTKKLFEKYTLPLALTIYRADHLKKLEGRINDNQIVFPLPVAFSYNKWSLKQYWENLDNPLMLACEVPAGTPLIPMEGNPASGDGEYEVLLCEGTVFEIVNIEALSKNVTSVLINNTVLNSETIALYSLDLKSK